MTSSVARRRGGGIFKDFWGLCTGDSCTSADQPVRWEEDTSPKVDMRIVLYKEEGGLYYTIHVKYWLDVDDFEEVSEEVPKKHVFNMLEQRARYVWGHYLRDVRWLKFKQEDGSEIDIQTVDDFINAMKRERQVYFVSKRYPYSRLDEFIGYHDNVEWDALVSCLGGNPKRELQCGVSQNGGARARRQPRKASGRRSKSRASSGAVSRAHGTARAGTRGSGASTVRRSATGQKRLRGGRAGRVDGTLFVKT